MYWGKGPGGLSLCLRSFSSAIEMGRLKVKCPDLPFFLFLNSGFLLSYVVHRAILYEGRSRSPPFKPHSHLGAVWSGSSTVLDIDLGSIFRGRFGDHSKYSSTYGVFSCLFHSSPPHKIPPRRNGCHPRVPCLSFENGASPFWADYIPISWRSTFFTCYFCRFISLFPCPLLHLFPSVYQAQTGRSINTSATRNATQTCKRST